MMFTGDTIDDAKAAEWGLANLSVPPDELDSTNDALARRVEGVPKSHLMMYKLVVNQVWLSMGLEETQMFATVFDGITRHNPEGDEAKALVASLEKQLAQAKAEL